MIQINDTEEQDIKRLYDCHAKNNKKVKVSKEPILSFTAIDGIIKPIYKTKIMKILKFGKPTCRPCVVLSEMMKELDLSKYEVKDIVYNYDTESTEICEQYGVRNIPMLIVLDADEKEVERFRSFHELKNYLEK
jgi:hypothetical protein